MGLYSESWGKCGLIALVCIHFAGFAISSSLQCFACLGHCPNRLGMGMDSVVCPLLSYPLWKTVLLTRGLHVFQ